MKHRIIQLLSLIALVSASHCVWAWHATPHRIVAQIAYNHLTPAAGDQVDRIINHLHKIEPKVHDVASASVLPDRIKFEGITIYNHWHYINLPKPDKHNIVWVINKLIKSLKDKQANKTYQALNLSFLLHLVGDIHEPMHCIQRYSGGNSYPIKGRAKNLHTLWDEAFYFYGKNKHYRYWAKRLDQEMPKPILAKALKTELPFQWAKESYAIARDVAYQTPLGKRPTIGYRKQGERLLKRRIVVAGYRLAHILNDIFDGKGDQAHEIHTGDGSRENRFIDRVVISAKPRL